MAYSDPEVKRAKDAAYHAANREKRLAYARAYNEAHRDARNAARRGNHAANRAVNNARHRVNSRLRNGWTELAYLYAFDRQGGVCYIPSCSRPIQHADHDHGTGRPRKLLCQPCNQALNRHMTPALLHELADYLEEHEQEDDLLTLWVNEA